jgi:hypothetical protein
MVKARMVKYLSKHRAGLNKETYKVKLEKLCARFTRIHLGAIATREFNYFLENHKTDFNRSFTTSANEFNELVKENQGEENFSPEIVTKVWEGG